VDASNVALLGQLELGEVRTRVIYKPTGGERPLWDFPDGTLAERETAAFVLSAAGGWNIVPPTVLRQGPLGRGSVQLWVDVVEGATESLIDVVTPAALLPGWLPVLEAQLSDGTAVVVAHADRPELASAAVFDVVINNADRKAGHCLLGDDGKIWLIDHGVSFSDEPKLRTVIWEFVGEPIPDQLCADLTQLATELEPGGSSRAELRKLLAEPEVEATAERLARLLALGRFPEPEPGVRPFPWPPI